MLEGKRLSLVKPTLQTPFHIDFDWWQEHDRSWRVYLRNVLPSDIQEGLGDADPEAKIDIVDSETAEVKQVDGLLHLLITKVATRDDFLTEHTAMVDAIFRIFLANANKPLNAEELSQRLGRPSQTILRTLSGPRVYRGVRPILES